MAGLDDGTSISEIGAGKLMGEPMSGEKIWVRQANRLNLGDEDE
jgi:hypothetical protein